MSYRVDTEATDRKFLCFLNDYRVPMHRPNELMRDLGREADGCAGIAGRCANDFLSIEYKRSIPAVLMRSAQ